MYDISVEKFENCVKYGFQCADDFASYFIYNIFGGQNEIDDKRINLKHYNICY